MSAPLAVADAPVGEATIGELLAPTGLPALLDQTPSELLGALGFGHLVPAPQAAPAEVTMPQHGGAAGGGARADGVKADGAKADGAGGHGAAGEGDSPTNALPALDPLGLLAPIAELLRTFGSGTLPGGDSDPTAMLSTLSQVLQTGVGAATSAIKALEGLWQGDSATGAAVKSSLSAANGGELAAQGTSMTGTIQGGLAVVAAGLAQLQAVAVKTAGLIAGTLPVIATPPGQLAALGFAADGLAEAVAVVAATRTQLMAPTAKMAADGAPVGVTAPPATGDVVGGLLDAGLPLLSSGLQLAGTVLSAAASATGFGGAGGGAAGGLGGDAGSAALGGVPLTAGAGGLGGAGGMSASGSAGGGSGGGAMPTLRATGLGGGALGSGAVGGSIPATEPVLGARPVTAEPGLASGASSSGSAGWNRPTSAVAPMTPLAPAMATPSGARGSTMRTAVAVESTMTDAVGDAGSLGAWTVAGDAPRPEVTVDVDFRLTDATPAT